jgi:hypothetical protein
MTKANIPFSNVGKGPSPHSSYPCTKHFCVRVVRTKDVSSQDEAVSQLRVVIDLAVEDNDDLAVLVVHRLMTAFDIKHRKGAYVPGRRRARCRRRSQTRLDPDVSGLTHPLEIADTSRSDETGDATHQVGSRFRTRLTRYMRLD